MMDDAKWRDKQRKKNVDRYKEEDDKESKQMDSYKGDAGFLK